MGDEGDIGGDKERKDSAEVPTSSSGQRLDQFLTGAQRLGDIAREKARGVANAAAPKFKELQKNASANASRLLDGRSGSSSILSKIRTYLGSGSRLRKGLILYGGFLIMLLLLSKLMTSNGRDEPGPDRANLEKIKSGMTEEQVDKLLGTPTAAEKHPDGSLAKTWTPTATNDGPIHLTFVNGKVATKLMDEPAAVATSSQATPAPTDTPTPTETPAAQRVVEGELVAKDVPDSFFHSAKHAAELNAMDAAHRMNAAMDGTDANYYDVEATTGADGKEIPNEYVAVIYVKTPTNAFGTRRDITLNLFYKYKPDTKELYLVDTKQADHGFTK